MIDYLRYYARPYFFSTSIPTPVIAGLLEVFDILENDTSFHSALWRNIRYFRENLQKIGFDTGNSESAIIPIIVSDEVKLKAFLRDLFQAGICMNYVAYPAVPKKKPRLRIGMMAQHQMEDLNMVLENFRVFRKKT